MEKSLVKVCVSLDDLAQSILGAYADDRTFTELFGWNCPALNRHNVANLANNISKKLKQYDLNDFDKELITSIDLIPARINLYKSKTLPQLFNGNCLNAMAAYMALIV